MRAAVATQSMRNGYAQVAKRQCVTVMHLSIPVLLNYTFFVFFTEDEV